MSLAWVLRFSASMAYYVSAHPSSGSENQFIAISLPSTVSHLNYPSHRSITPIDISTENALDIRCDGAQYGVNLDIADCKDAKYYISSGSEEVPWVKRRFPFFKPGFVLPYRYMGGKYPCPCSL